MLRPPRSNPKQDTLRRHGTLNLHPNQVADELFQTCDFFDPNDLVQVKYEMLRRVRVDHKTIRRVAQDFGFSRLSVYHAQAAFERAGLAGLLPAKRGPRRSHKLDDAVMAFIREQLRHDRSLRAVELARRVRDRFALTVHPRSIERALERTEKKLPEGEAEGKRNWDRYAIDCLGAYYERLRGQILQGLRNSHSLAGLGILMGQGMRAWMENCRESAQAIGSSAGGGSSRVSIPAPLQAQVVHVIASMVWNRERKEPS